MIHRVTMSGSLAQARQKFPRAGAWVVAPLKNGLSQLGVLFSIGKETIVPKEEIIDGRVEMVNKTVIEVDEPFAEIHFVNHGPDDEDFKHGETVVTRKNVPLDQVRQATADEVRSLQRNAHASHSVMHLSGYQLSDEDAAELRDSLTPLQRRRHGMTLSADENAAADVEAEAEAQADKDRQYIAKQPAAIAAEEQIEKERLEFVARVGATRERVAQEILFARDHPAA